MYIQKMKYVQNVSNIHNDHMTSYRSAETVSAS